MVNGLREKYREDKKLGSLEKNEVGKLRSYEDKKRLKIRSLGNGKFGRLLYFPLSQVE